MAKAHPEPDRYISFEGIDCYQNARDVVTEILALTGEEEASDAFWERFKGLIPESYYRDTPDEALLYLVCSNVFYIEELFEEKEHEKGFALMRKCELECC